MRLNRGFRIFLLAAAGTVCAFSHIYSAEKPKVIFESEPEDVTCISKDNDGDGKTDYLLRVNDAGEKIFEENDFNHDGKMDDFYYYDQGVLQRREIDSNFDGKIDLWVYLHKGVYVERYERDLDFDGEIDQVKDFGETDKE